MLTCVVDWFSGGRGSVAAAEARLGREVDEVVGWWLGFGMDVLGCVCMVWMLGCEGGGDVVYCYGLSGRRWWVCGGEALASGGRRWRNA